MQNNELETIAAAMQEALHRAYALGRSDALRRVVELVQSDELGSKTVALLSHSEPAVVEAPTAEFESSAPSHSFQATTSSMPEVMPLTRTEHSKTGRRIAMGRITTMPRPLRMHRRLASRRRP